MLTSVIKTLLLWAILCPTDLFFTLNKMQTSPINSGGLFLQTTGPEKQIFLSRVFIHVLDVKVFRSQVIAVLYRFKLTNCARQVFRVKFNFACVYFL